MIIGQVQEKDRYLMAVFFLHSSSGINQHPHIVAA